MNVQVATNKPCQQPSGEHESDNIDAESSFYQSFLKGDIKVGLDNY